MRAAAAVGIKVSNIPEWLQFGSGGSTGFWSLYDKRLDLPVLRFDEGAKGELIHAPNNVVHKGYASWSEVSLLLSCADG